MAQKNLVSVNIPEADLKDCKAAIAVLKAKLMPHLLSLSPQDRLELPKMGEKTVSFVDKGSEYAQKYAELAPSYLDLDALKLDIATVKVTRDLIQDLTPVVDALGDTMMAAGSEAYQGVLVYYGSSREAARQNAPNAQTVYTDLAARFPGATTARKKA